jgi:2-aminoadipate transaminase
VEVVEDIFAERIVNVPRSFIREILKVSLDPEIISFAGGLPNRDFFPVEEIEMATGEVFRNSGRDILQYSNSEGLLALREYIAERYFEKKGLKVSPEDILITNGSQQGLDLLGKVLINTGDGVVVEEPGYLGAIQSLSIFRPTFLPVPLVDAGLDIDRLKSATAGAGAKFLYAVPNFQNPSGLTYSEHNRRRIAEVAAGEGFLIVEDDPYGELRFDGAPQPSFYSILPEQTILLGSFSKIVAPGFRIGWIVASGSIREKILVAKQAADLHTSGFAQHILCRYLLDNDIDRHIARIIEVYGRQCRAMEESIARHLPKDIRWTHPEGGMFLWGRLPGDLSSMRLFDFAVREKVVFVPGDPFYTAKTQVSTLRLNFSCASEETIERGVLRLAEAFAKMMNE